MSRFRVAFFGTPEFAVASLRLLISDEHYDVVGVVTQPDRPAGRNMRLTPSPVKLLAESHGLPVLCPERASHPDVLEEMRRWRAECGVVVAFGQILSQNLLNLFAKGCVNVHASLLPRWRGAAPIQRALMEGDSETGVALQKVVRKLDAGDVLGIRRVPITDATDAISLHDQLKNLGADLLHVELMDYLRGNLTGVPQDESLVTLAPKIAKEEAQINWHRSARQIFNQVRGLASGPVCWTRDRQGKLLKIWKTRVVDETGAGQPGRVFGLLADGMVVECGAGRLELLEVQPESKTRMSALAYARGYQIQAGYQLGVENEE